MNDRRVAHTCWNFLAWVVGIAFMVFGLASWAAGQSPLGDPNAGKSIYEKHCLSCHGQDGDGQGPDRRFLLVPPANFHSLESRSKTDWELMTIITFGIAYSPMHGWSDRLTEQERWDVLRYIRLLAPYNPIT